MLKPLLTTGFLYLIAFSPYSVFAQSAGDDASVVTYNKDYFVKYGPVTLLDMLQRVPGVQAIIDQSGRSQGGGTGSGGKTERGFGSGGDQILINNKRLSGKANNIKNTLERISATQVQRVELIRGASSDLDVQSQGLVVNIIMQEGTSTASTFWKIGGRYSAGYKISPDLLVSHNGSKGNLEYLLGAEIKQSQHIENRFDKSFTPDHVFFADADRVTDNLTKALKFNGNMTYSFGNGDTLRLNGQFEPGKYTKREPRSSKALTALREFQDWNEDRTFQRWEIGGDYTTNIGRVGVFKTLFIANRDRIDEQGLLLDLLDSGNIPVFKNDKFRVKKEKIIRSSLTRNITGSQILEVGVEAAFNHFDKKFTQQSFDTGSFVLNTNDDVEVKENRYEFFANHTYNVTSKIVLQSSLTGEFSKISSVTVPINGANIERSKNFQFLKPRVDFRYDLTNSDQFRATVERKVSQLDFKNFVAEFDPNLDIIRLGNTGIVPEKSWNYSLTYEHRLPKDAGAVQVEFFYRDITDYIGLVDFTEFFDVNGAPIVRSNLDFISVSGNIPKAKAYGIKVNSSLRLGFFGLPEALFSVDYKWEKTDVKEQFSGIQRQFDHQQEHQLTLNYRHDVTKWNMSYGFKGTFVSDDTRHEIDEIAVISDAPTYEAFVEVKIFNDLKLSFIFEHLTLLDNDGHLRYYNDHVRFNDLNRIETRKWTVVREFSVFLQGTF